MNWSDEQKREVYYQTHGRCGRCDKKHRIGDHGVTWHMGHIKARALGGSDDSINLEVECIRCNTSAGADDGEYHYCSAIKNDGYPCTVKLTDRRVRYCGRHRP
jgi:hypothetical protein